MDDKIETVKPEGKSEQPNDEKKGNPERDWFLNALIRQVDFGKLSFPITVFVKGVVVSGQAIGGREYFRKFGEVWDVHAGGITDDEYAGFYEEMKPALDAVYPVVNDDEESSRPPSTFIHIDDARVYVPGERGMPENGVLWRGLVEEIDAWSLGSFKLGPPPSE